MIHFERDGHRFNYRVGAIVIHNGKVLLHHAAGEHFWVVPGGRAEMGECAEDTVRREMREELSTEVEVLRLLWFVENFFTYDGRAYHEISLYFLVRFAAGSRLLELETFESVDTGTPLYFRWFPVDEASLAGLPLVPSFLAAGLVALPDSVRHVIQRDAS